MQLHTIKRKTKNRKKRVVGRGGKHAKTSGRGTKGQSARAGHKKRPELRDIIKKLPKRRGRGKNIFQAFRVKPSVINLENLELAFATGAEVTPEILVEMKLIKKTGGRIPTVKILSEGALTKSLNVSGVIVSAGAKAKIEKAGGMVK
jgi:large subunit ribosomal protein L15